MQEVKNHLNKVAFEQALKAKNISQLLLAEKIGVNPKSFSRWINEGFVYSKYLLDVAEILDLSEDEFAQILLVPKFNVCFRKKFLGAVSEEVRTKAIELAKTLFRLTYLRSDTHFCPPNASHIQEPLEVANQIRKYIGISSFTNLQGIVASLAEQGVEIAVIPFSKLNLVGDGELEKAFSVTDGKRCAIFLDSDCSEELLIFNLCHELSHLFRPGIDFSKTEETLCNEVASELVYPKSYFEPLREKIERILNGGAIETSLNLVDSIHKDLGGDLFGVILRMKQLGFLSQKDPLHKKLFGFGKKRSEALPKVEDQLFLNYRTNDGKTFAMFWESEEIEKNSLLRFFSHIKNGVIDGTISPRKLSELFGLSLGMAEDLSHKWQSALRLELKAI